MLELHEQDDTRYFALLDDPGFYGKPVIWIVITLSKELNNAYFRSEISLREVMERSPALYRGDHCYAGEGAHDLTPMLLTDIDPTDLPTPDAFYSELLARDDLDPLTLVQP